MSTPSPSGAPKTPPPVMIPVTPMPDTICVPALPHTTAQPAKRARTANEEDRHAHFTATANPIEHISSTTRNVISATIAKTEVYRTFATFIDTELARVSVISPAHAREVQSLARTITAALEATPGTASPTPDSISPAVRGKRPATFAEIAKGSNSASASASASRATPHTSGLTRKATPTPTSPQSEGRVFLRLDKHSPYGDTETFAIRQEVTKLLRLPSTDIAGCHKVPTGFALVPKNDGARQTLLARKDEIGAHFGCVQVEVPKKWATYAVQNVPMTMRLGMAPVDTTAAIEEEVFVQTGQKAVALRPSQHYRPGEAFTTWLISFEKPVSSFRLFDDSNVSRLVQKRRPLDQCAKCLEWHGRKACPRVARCFQCGQAAHGECDRHTQCANCRGPFESTHDGCPMRPKRQGDTVIRPTPQQRSDIRRNGGMLSSKKYDRPAPRDSEEDTAMSSDELPSHSFAPSGPENSDSPDEDTIVVQLSDYTSSDDAIRHSSRHKTPSKRAAARDTHEIALQAASEAGADVIMIQEPRTWFYEDRCGIPGHPLYALYTPARTWIEDAATHPRVATYVRNGMAAGGYTLGDTRDLLWVKTQGVTFVNIYRRSNDASALELLQNWQPTTKTLLAGDFNAKHHTWQPGAETSEGATRIIDYVTEHSLDLLTAPGVPTHNCGNTIDLTFSNIPLCSTRIAPEADCGSDHQVCITDIPTHPVELPRRRLVLREDPEAIRLYAENVSFLMGSVPLLPTGEDSPERLDELAEALCNVLTEALQISCRPSRPEKNAKWWNKTCAQASRMFRNYRHNNPNPIPQRVEALRQEFKRVVREAKQLFVDDFITKARNDQDIFRIVAWHKPRDQMEAPPLVINGQTIIEPEAKAEALRTALLERNSEEEDLETGWVPTVPRRCLSWSSVVHADEVYKTLCGTGNTSPSSDGITVRMLKASWESIKDSVQRLYQGCVATGYHPQVFRRAEVAMIPKAGKDQTTAKGWRPISLLSCLGKALNALLAGGSLGRLFLTGS
ncbi:unnamed protein product [Sordaria macrospora k-hell]|uniref:WGS project CABT00000000 data, contig 2.90 n=1 Tax=Sordaria macrospora (strain ATCC MYA-333 / DSM 997 / K(L3346) / K-hell) TaxID=771870 RepID=F7WBZ6_SORMK|nr:uncharacterized protein SMAC_09418 [Sordaria macrospora k-hell]CCC14518.1 unnamed protein product [Sordaria macrospora k-hell]